MKATAEPQNARQEGGLRVYQWGDIDCLSVTSIRTLLGQPHPLVNWRINAVLDRVFDVEEFTAQLGVSQAAARTWLRDGEGRLTDSDRHTEAERGTAVHQAIELDLQPEQCTDEVRPYIVQYRHMKAQVGFKVLLQERQVWNLKARYAGTFDALVASKDGPTVLVDWKTSKEVYADYVFQAHAYLAAEFVGNDGVVDDKATALLHTARRGAIAKLSPLSWEWDEFDFDPDILRAWLGSLMYAQYAHEHPDVRKAFDIQKKGTAR